MVFIVFFFFLKLAKPDDSNKNSSLSFLLGGMQTTNVVSLPINKSFKNKCNFIFKF